MNLRLCPNFLEKKDWDTTISKTLKSQNWSFSGSSADKDFDFWYMELTQDNFFSEYFLNKIENTFKKKFKLSRVYANGQTHGLSGSMHQDNGEDVDNTFLYYVGPEWSMEWGGHTIFHDSISNETISQFPIPNLGILFDSNLQHFGMEPTRHCKKLRVSIAFKMKEIGEM